MRTDAFRLTVLCSCLCLLALRAAATTHYVDVNSSNPIAPYTNWTTAATQIQDAVNAAVSGDIILVTNGVYQYGGDANGGSNRVDVAENIALQSVSGPAVTTIEGYQVPGATNGAGAVRCIFLNNGASLSGFTLTNGATEAYSAGLPYNSGGAVMMEAGCTISNCVITGNASTGNGGGVSSVGVGGGSTVINCILAGNVSTFGGWGGGAYGCTLLNCVVNNNDAEYGGGVGSCTVYNSLLTANGSTNSTDGGAAYLGMLDNCTIVGNYSRGLGAADGSAMANSIIYFNHNGMYADCYQCLLTNCCTSSLNNNGIPVNCITNLPAFLDMAHGNYRLQIGSLCVDAGDNAFVTINNDLDGNPRIVGAAVDLGCYENQNTNPVHYVSLTSTNPTPPYTNWPTAAINIQSAVAAAQPGDIVAADAGVYSNGDVVMFGAETNRVALTNGVALVGVYGSSSTLIVGGVQTRCLYMGSNTVLMGFTLTHGTTRNAGDATNEESGGGAWCQSLSSHIINCTIISNTAAVYGGGVYSGTLSNCLLITNVAVGPFYNDGLGGGAHASVLYHCTLARNYANYYGGGADDCALDNCLVSNNIVYYLGYGGGVSASSVTNCLLIGNGGSFNNGSGIGGGAYSSQLYSCLIISNSAQYGGGANDCVLNNCTIANNYARNWGGGVGGIINQYGSMPSTLNNCILYYNNIGSPQSGQAGTNYYGDTLNYCCTLPLPTNGIGNITNVPLFVSITNDFHLQSNSPCINSGNNAYVVGANDFDGNPRVVGGTVDIGAYEFQTPTSVISYAYLQQYGLPTDGSVDFANLDSTAFNVYQDWIAELNPTNPASVLAMLIPTSTNAATGVKVTWQSVSGIPYFLQRSTNLLSQPPFSTIQSNITGQTNTTSFIDASATNNVPYFYRVGVVAP